jgi:hypothetical protein
MERINDKDARPQQCTVDQAERGEPSIGGNQYICSIYGVYGCRTPMTAGTFCSWSLVLEFLPFEFVGAESKAKGQ